MACVLRQLLPCRSAAAAWLTALARPRSFPDSAHLFATHMGRKRSTARSVTSQLGSEAASKQRASRAIPKVSAAATARPPARGVKQRSSPRLSPRALIIEEKAEAEHHSEIKHEEGSHQEQAAQDKSKGNRKRRGKSTAGATDVAVDVTETARVAAKTSVKRRRGREALDVSIEEVLETAEEAEALQQAEPATKRKKGRRKAAVKEGHVSEEVELMELPTAFPPGKLVGCHVSAASGCERAVVNAASVGAKAFALDTRSKRRWECPPLQRATAAAFRAACNKFGFSPGQILPHGSYLINLGSPDAEMLRKSYAAFLEELQRCEALGIRLYNIHPGHANSCGETSTPEECMDLIADSINRAHAETSGVTVVLENVAGQGSSVGHSFEQLAYMIERVQDSSRIGVCLDTCHMFAAGYDLATPSAYAATMQRFADVVGWRYLKGMHINDSKCALGSRRDRHENVGRGMIGIKMFECIMNDSRLDGIPLIMETPVQEEGPAINYKKSLLAGEVVLRHEEEAERIGTDKRDIAMLNSLCK